jgi:hypothetical protein
LQAVIFHIGSETGEFEGADHAAAALYRVRGATESVGIAVGDGCAHGGDAGVRIVEAHGVELAELVARHGLRERGVDGAVQDGFLSAAGRWPCGRWCRPIECDAEVFDGEGFEQEVVEGAGLGGGDRGSAHGEELGAGCARRAQGVGERIAGDAGHLHVGQDGVGQMGSGLGESFEGLFAGFVGVDQETGFDGEQLQHLSAEQVVVDDGEAAAFWIKCRHAPKVTAARHNTKGMRG